jgi:hypothetical protein
MRRDGVLSWSWSIETRDSQLREAPGCVVPCCGGFHGAINVCDAAILADVNGHAGRESQLQHSVGSGDFLVLVAQDWIVELERFREFSISFGRVHAGREIGHLELL